MITKEKILNVIVNLNSDLDKDANIEYLRGCLEMGADIIGIKGECHVESSIKLAIELNVSKIAIVKMYGEFGEMYFNSNNV